MEEGATNGASQTLKPKYDWYQSDSSVVITVMIKNVKKEELSVKYEEKSFSVDVTRSDDECYSLKILLSHAINPSTCSTKILKTKLECKLMKIEGLLWKKLEGEDDGPQVSMNATASDPQSTEDAALKYPSSAHYTRDWDKVVHDITEEEKKEKPEGEEALNDLFQNIYKDGNDEVRKAMNKSFVESGGTVLSTNWSEINKGKVDVKPPDGMEYKKYEH